MYCLLQELGVTDSYWHFENLQVIPIPVIATFVLRLQTRKQNDQNAVQYAISHYVAAKLSRPADKKKGVKEKIFSHQDFLPWSPTHKKDTDTLTVLRKVVDSGVLPAKVHAAALARIHG